MSGLDERLDVLREKGLDKFRRACALCALYHPEPPGSDGFVKHAYSSGGLRHVVAMGAEINIVFIHETQADLRSQSGLRSGSGSGSGRFVDSESGGGSGPGLVLENRLRFRARAQSREQAPIQVVAKLEGALPPHIRQS